MLVGAPGLGHWVPGAVPTLLRASCGQGLPFPPLAQGASQAGVIPLFFCHHKASSATTEASTISVMLWQWRGRAGAPPPTPAGSWSSGRAGGGEGMGCAARRLP